MNFKSFYLNESRNYPTDIELFQKYKNQDVYYSYRSIDKLGINPNSKYDTPNGIYAYPVKYQNPEEVKFTGDTNSGIVYFFKLKYGTNLLDISRGLYPKTKLASDLKKLETAGYNVDLDFDKANIDTPAGHLWYALYKNQKNANNWNYLLRKVLGYDAVLDTGYGIIHNNEPAQIVVLNPTSVEILEKGMFDKRLDFERFDLSNIKKENQLKYVDAFINNLKKKSKEKVIGESLFGKIIHSIDSSNYRQFIQSHIDDIKLKNLTVFDRNTSWDIDQENTKAILLWMEPIIDVIINTDPRQISYFPRKYQMELIKHFKLSFPDHYTTLYSVGYVVDLDDKIEFMKMFPKFAVRELESTPSGIFNYFKDATVHVDKMLKVVDVFKNTIKKLDTKTKKVIYMYFERYANEDQLSELQKTMEM